MKILVVDDEKLLVKGIKFNLENDGYEVDAAYDGEEAVGLVNENKYDVILLDLMLPKIDGLEACRRIREFSNVPVIMLTAKTGDNDKLIGFEYGADDYITKPFNILELKARIRAILRRAGSTGGTTTRTASRAAVSSWIRWSAVCPWKECLWCSPSRSLTCWSFSCAIPGAFTPAKTCSAPFGAMTPRAISAR